MNKDKDLLSEEKLAIRQLLLKLEKRQLEIEKSEKETNKKGFVSDARSTSLSDPG